MPEQQKPVDEQAVSFVARPRLVVVGSRHKTLSIHFESLPMIDKVRWQEVNYLEDLTAAIELYNTLIGLERYDDARSLFHDRLEYALLYRLGAFRQSAELLEMLFPDGLDQLPRLSTPGGQAYALAALGLSITDQPGHAAMFYRRHNDIREKENDQKNLSISLCNLSDILRSSGALYESEAAARRGLLITRELHDQFWESDSLYWLGITLAAQGKEVDSAKALYLSLEFARQAGAYEVYEYLAMRAMWFGEYAEAQILAKRAMTYYQEKRDERRIICAARLQGEAALALSDLPTAEERLHHALARARAVNHVGVELPALIGLAELRRRQSDLKSARELLDDVWEPCERGPSKLFHADAYNVLTQIERDTGNHKAAVKAAIEAYRLAWCDGPPFDESKYEPMPEGEI
jgi:tetratricopeptide (TPR) repeat protein